jgi:hypothetical protein
VERTLCPPASIPSDRPKAARGASGGVADQLLAISVNDERWRPELRLDCLLAVRRARLVAPVRLSLCPYVPAPHTSECDMSE